MNENTLRSPRLRAARFALVSAVGAGIDFLGATGSLRLGAPLPLALVVGWFAGLGIGYLAQALWTFRVPMGWKSFLQFGVNCAFLLPIRYVAIMAMALVSPAGFYWDCLRIFLAMCVTLVVNYQVSRSLIFRTGAAK